MRGYSGSKIGYKVEGHSNLMKHQGPDLHTYRRYYGKDSDAGRDWGQEEKGTTEDELAGWHH